MAVTCPYCGKPLVEVDNPFRREVRHRRGEEVLCPGPSDGDGMTAPRTLSEHLAAHQADVRKATSGTWRADLSPGDGEGPAVMADEFFVATCHNNAGDGSEDEDGSGNATFIAKSDPVIVGALLRVARAVEKHHFNDALDALDALLAAYEGRAQ